jgi:threonyl-tRNA synthetase
VPYTIVIGGKEVESGNVKPRHRADLPEIGESPTDEFLQKLSDTAKSRK